jgi:uncharacterized delta-60 repeat protein
MLVRCLAVSMFCGASLALPSPALARGHLDPSFGEGGVVDLRTRLKPSRNTSLEQVRLGPEGEIFFTEGSTTCGPTVCSKQIYLRRYGADGDPDLGFGGSGVAVGAANRDGFGRDANGLLAVDSVGRPLAAFESEGIATVRRFEPDGSPDSSFGAFGTTFVRCNCYLDSIEAAPGGKLLLIGHSEFKRGGAFGGTIWFLARLNADGFLDPKFGGNGVVQRSMPDYYEPSAKIERSGGILLYGFICCHYSEKAFVRRLSKGGRLQRRYAVAAKRALNRLHDTRWGELDWEGEMTIVQRSRGWVDVFGEANEHGVAVRLRRNGSRDSAFGRREPWGRSLEFSDAAGDGFGGTFVVGFLGGRDGYKVIHLRPDGRFDRGFGRVDLPNAYNEEGLEIFPQGRGRAIVFSGGLSSCRQYCPPQPKLFRVVGSRR